VPAFGLVELQRPGERLQDAVGHPGEVAALELGVVLHAHPGEVGDLPALEAGHPPVGREGGRPAAVGVSRARRVVRKSLTSSRLSTPPPYGRAAPRGVGCRYTFQQ